MSRLSRRYKAQNVPASNATNVEDLNRSVDRHPDVQHADLEQMDSASRAMYRDAIAAQAEATREADQRQQNLREFVIRGPFKLGFVVALGVLAAILVGDMIGKLSTILMYIVGALFIALALDPIVRWLERKNVKRGLGIGIVFAAFVLIIAGVLALIVPMLANQITQLAKVAPSYFTDIGNQAWYQWVQNNFGHMIDLNGLVEKGQGFVTDPTHWAQVAGGVWKAGLGIANGLTATLIVLILGLYFLSSLQAMKRAFYLLVSRSNRAQVIDITEQITKSVGGYVNGIVLLALINASLGFIMMMVVGVPFPALVAVGIFFLALIPLFGSVLATVLVTVIALFESPTAALIAAIYYLIYMQVESYLLTPRVMNRVVSVPGALVVIGALAGGTLLGLLGALISIPVTAMVLMITKQLWIPRQQLK